MRVLRRFWPIALLLAALTAAWASGLTQQVSWAALARNQALLIAWVASHPIMAPSLYMLIYAAAVLVLLPESAVLTVAGGLLFGSLSGGILAIVGSSVGAIALFIAIRHHLADAFAARRGRFVDAVRLSLQRDGFSYLLAIRLVPAFPFWLVNLAAALSGMQLLPYAGATVLGIMPATFIFASIGAGLGGVLSAGGSPDLAVIFSPHILGPLIGLAALSLLPVAWRRWKRSGA
ncbi:MAG TPA: VTT domain-containing protein [Acetobacteraceae bacterium]